MAYNFPTGTEFLKRVDEAQKLQTFNDLPKGIQRAFMEGLERAQSNFKDSFTVRIPFHEAIDVTHAVYLNIFGKLGWDVKISPDKNSDRPGAMAFTNFKLTPILKRD